MPRIFYDFLGIADIGCWCLCFWWMHRISARQNAVLAQLGKQAQRIEKISKEEHAILSELHPNVESSPAKSPALREKSKNNDRELALDDCAGFRWN